VYFKSSPYGSYNHSHADQNSFVINARGRSLAIDSGYYDYYGSDHWNNWYKRTVAHNAVTFDGGQGQMHDTMAAKGRIVRFESTKNLDVTIGDATPAYGGGLTRAVRTLVYLRPDTLLVYDSLASATPRTWEWNIHALRRMQSDSSRTFEIKEEGVRLCGRVLEGPATQFEQTDRFTAEPKGDYPRQWNGRFVTREKTPESRILTVLQVGCKSPAVSSTAQGSDIQVSIAGRNLLFHNDGQVEVR
jgi:heparinase II/III-like protein